MLPNSSTLGAFTAAILQPLSPPQTAPCPHTGNGPAGRMLVSFLPGFSWPSLITVTGELVVPSSTAAGVRSGASIPTAL